MSEYERRSPVSALLRGARFLRGPPRPPRAAAYPFAGAASCVEPRYLCHAEFQVVTPLSPGSVGAVTGCEGVGANPSPNAPSA